MKSLIALGVLMFLAFITLARSKKQFVRKGWLCLIFSYAALWVAFFSFGFKWWILLIFGIFLFIGLGVWINVETENSESLRDSADAQQTVPGIFNSIANEISGNNSFAQGFFGTIANAAANGINNKLGQHGFFTPQESESANAARGINKVFVFGTLICIVVSYFLSR